MRWPTCGPATAERARPGAPAPGWTRAEVMRPEVMLPAGHRGTRSDYRAGIDSDSRCRLRRQCLRPLRLRERRWRRA
jgi:hypothetical protein